MRSKALTARLRCAGDLHGAKALARLGKTLKLEGAAGRSVPQYSLKRLRLRQILIQTEVGVYQFEDETFKEWLLTERTGTHGSDAGR